MAETTLWTATKPRHPFQQLNVLICGESYARRVKNGPRANDNSHLTRFTYTLPACMHPRAVQNEGSLALAHLAFFFGIAGHPRRGRAEGLECRGGKDRREGDGLGEKTRREREDDPFGLHAEQARRKSGSDAA